MVLIHTAFGAEDMSKKNAGINVGINVGINKTEKAVLGILISNPEKTAEESSLPI